MSIRQRRYSKEELAARGQALYESQIQHYVEPGNEGKIVAVDVDTGAFEIANSVLPATNQLFERYPDAQPWVVRVGHRAVYHFGARSLADHRLTETCLPENRLTETHLTDRGLPDIE